jgi:hypothetical protein
MEGAPLRLASRDPRRQLRTIAGYPFSRLE